MALGPLISLLLAVGEVPPKLALMVMLKVLTYDVNFASRGTGDFLVLVPFAQGSEAAAEQTVQLAEKSDVKTINDRPLKFVSVPLAELADASGAAVLLHAGMTRETAHEVLSKVKVYSLAFDEALTKEGAMVSVASNAGKPQVVINTATARAIHAELAGAVLKVAKTVQ